MYKFADRMLDHFRLVSNTIDIDALRHRFHEFSGGSRHVLAELDNVGALGGDHADADRGLTLLTHDEARRIDVTMADGRDVAKTKDAAVAFHRRLRNGFHAIERTGDAKRHALRRGLDRAGWHDIVLLGERIAQRLRRGGARR